MKLDNNYSIFGKVPNYQVKELVEQCKANGRYDKYANYYISMKKASNDMCFESSKFISELGEICV